MRISKNSLFLLSWFVIQPVTLIAHSATPYAGNQSTATRPTIVPTAPPVTPVSKPLPVKNSSKNNMGTIDKR